MAGSVVAQDEMAMADGPALSFSGKAQLGVIYEGDIKDGNTVTKEAEFVWNAEMDIGIAGEGVTDGGLTFGASTNINAEADGNEVETPDVYIGGEMWKITVGSPDVASELAFSLGDVGFEGLGIDDVAEKFNNQHGTDYGVKDAAQARLDLTFGVATIGVSVGQTAATQGKAGEATPASYTIYHSSSVLAGAITVTGAVTTGVYSVTTNAPSTITADADGNFKVEFVQTEGAGTDDEKKTVVDAYVRNTADEDSDPEYSFWRVNGKKDVPVLDSDGEPTGAHNDPDNLNEDGTLSDNADTDLVDVALNATAPKDHNANSAYTNVAATFTEAMVGEATPGTKAKTNWALGTSVNLGVAKLGFGFDSEQKAQVSVGGDFGQFGGSIFYAQQDAKMADGSEKKLKGLGLEGKVTVQEGTTINAVWTQAEMEGASDKVNGFGAGVSHSLGGGATLQAGFAQVDDQNKASVGVAMTF